MQFTVLGKYGPFPPSGGKATSGYLLCENDTKIVLDMGAGTLTRLSMLADIGEIDAVFISHLHYDHTSDFLPLRYLLDGAGKKLKVITAFSDSPYYDLLFNHPNIEMINVKDGDEITVGSLRLSFFDMSHPIPCLAVRIEGEKTFVYTGDTVIVPRLYDAVKGADAVLCDCSQKEGFTGPHISCDKALIFQKETGVKLYATHFSPFFDPSEFFDGTPVTPVNELESYVI